MGGDIDYDYSTWSKCGPDLKCNITSYSKVLCGELYPCCTASETQSCASVPSISGHLGLGPSLYYKATPAEVTGMNGKAISVSCGRYHCLVLMSDGKMYAWGENTRKQLGNGKSGSNAREYTPVPVANSISKGEILSDVKIIAISAGDSQYGTEFHG